MRSILFILFFSQILISQDSLIILKDFPKNWQDSWHQETFFFTSRASYTKYEENGNFVLKAESDNDASIFTYKLDPKFYTNISWRWNVTQLLDNKNERSKGDDDYSARIFLLFEDDDAYTTICYVWASYQTKGSIYPSPYSEDVATIVVESGTDHVNTWINVERNIVNDFRSFFKKDILPLRAVGIMVDTDNTDLKASALFDDIVIYE